MNRLSIALLCLVGFVSAGVIVDRSQQDAQNNQGRTYGEHGGQQGQRDILLRQKFILDILQQVELPLQNQKLIELNIDGVLNENMYLGPLDDNMRLLLDLIRTNRVLGRNTLFSINNQQDVRQLAGLYLLLVRSRDFETFQRTAVYARIHINPVLFVNALILAIQDRADTEMLLNPALYEILPKLYQDDSVVRQVEALNLQQRRIGNNDNSIRPNILNIISLGRQNKQTNLREDGGIDILGRAQLWIPFRDMHKQLAIQKSLNGNSIVTNDQTTRQDDVVITSSKTHGLIADDIGLRSALDLLFGELILKQSVLRNTQNSNVDNNLHSRGNIGNIGNNGRSSISERLQNIPIRTFGNNRDNLLSERQILREGNTQQSDNDNIKNIGRGFSDESDYLNAHRDDDDNIRGSSFINNDRFLHNTRQDSLQLRRNQLNNELDDLNINRVQYQSNNPNVLLRRNQFNNQLDDLNTNRVQYQSNNPNVLLRRNQFNNQLDDLNTNRVQYQSNNPNVLLRRNQFSNQLDDLDLNRVQSQTNNRNVLLRRNQLDDFNLNRVQSQTNNRNINERNNIGVVGNDRRQLNNFLDQGTQISQGQLLLHQLQQLVARLNIEDISLGRIDNLRNLEALNLQQSGRIGGGVSSIDNRVDERQQHVVLNKINEISDRINGSLQKLIQHMRQTNQNDVNHIDHSVLIEILNEVISLCEYVPDGQVSSILENSTTQLLLRHIVGTIERQLQRLQGVRNNADIAYNGVRINDADIDRLNTYLEYTHVDLSNLIGGVGSEVNNRRIIGRIPRLNHKPFAIKLDINSEQNQRVVVRTLLVPKVDALGNQISPLQQRQNAVLLDIADVNLKAGRNAIVRQSRGITLTSRDITTYTELYQRVMTALQNGQDLRNDVTLIGQNNLLPHRLLIPRGRTEGLQMQLLIVITPAKQNNIGNIRNELLGLDVTALDNLPITYPLDRDINNLNSIISLSNVHLKDVLIYHDDQLKTLNQ